MLAIDSWWQKHSHNLELRKIQTGVWKKGSPDKNLSNLLRMDGVEEFCAQGLTFAQVITLQGVYSLPKFENLLTVSGRKKTWNWNILRPARQAPSCGSLYLKFSKSPLSQRNCSKPHTQECHFCAWPGAQICLGTALRTTSPSVNVLYSYRSTENRWCQNMLWLHTFRPTSGWLRIFPSGFPSQLEEEAVEQNSEKVKNNF